jgi:hypothetical protein
VIGLRRIVTSDGPAGVRGERLDERFHPDLVFQVGGRFPANGEPASELRRAYRFLPQVRHHLLWQIWL